MQLTTSTERDECLDAETLAAYIDGLLAHDAIERADRHIDHCRACRGELSALAATTSFPMGSASPPVPDLESLPIVEGTLGRYQVERELGRGNMGVVVRAYDPELARAVAIKILAPKWAYGPDARERLRREAQAMARLSHPNVVQVYDVTSQGELLAIAMELVEGTTLRDELAAGKPWQALLAICVAAGRGLAAAHAAKLIHRDYKPENVLCADGRVVVSDFGLARFDETPPVPLDVTLAGTPAYIAPELLLGAPASTASDQFSFCVATYEALYGERPFAGTRLEELRANMAAGRVRVAPVGSPIPIAVRSALLRGLSPDPHARWPSLEPLLAALDGAPRSRTRFVVAGAMGLAALGTIAVFGLHSATPACDVECVALRAERASDPDVDRANALLAAGRAQDAIDAASRVLAGTPPPAVRAAALLLRGRAEGLLERFDVAEQTLSEAITVAEQAQAGQVVAASWVELVQITGAQNHRFEAAQANMRAAEAAFARVDPGPELRARYAYVVGAMLLARAHLGEARGHLEHALVLLGPERVAERGVVHGALCDVYRQQRDIPKARAQCELAVELMGPEHHELGAVYNVWGTVELFDRRYADARAKWQRAIEIFERRNMQQDRGYALAFSNIGVSWAEQREPDKARPNYERARALFAQYHPKHVQRTLPLQGLASLALGRRDYRAAIAAYEDTLAVIEEAYGKEDTRRTTVLFNMALAYHRLPDPAKAHALAEEVIAQSSRPGREQWSLIAYALDLQAMLVERTRDWPRAIALRERALAALDHKDEPQLRAWIEMEIGRVMRNADQIAPSIPHLEHAVAFYTQDRSDRHRAGTAQYWLAKSLWETGGDRRRAVALARAARSDLESATSGLGLATHRREVADWLAKHK